MAVELSDEEMLRYSRQTVLRGLGLDGQERLKATYVPMVDLGRFGCAAAQYLTAAGVGQPTLLDFDTVPLSNLQHQALHSDMTIGQPKVDSAREALTRVNPHARLVLLNALPGETALARQIADHDLALDCTDGIVIRNQLSAGCLQRTTPLVSGTAIRMEGQIGVFTYQDGEPCYRCLSRLFSENVLTRIEAGVMALLVGTIGSLQAMEVIRLLTGYGAPVSGKIVIYDAMTCRFCEMKLIRHPQCEVCGSH